MINVDLTNILYVSQSGDSFKLNELTTCKRSFLVFGGLDELQQDRSRVDVSGIFDRPEEHLDAAVVLARVHHRLDQPLDDAG